MPFDVNSVKKFFLDSAAVRDALSAGERRALSKFGAFVRRRARSSIRTRKATSKPGQPPTNREGTLRRLIFFSYDPARKSVVIGPALGGPRSGAPERLEYGGTRITRGETIYITNEPGRDRYGRFVSRGRREVVLKGTINYKPRPYMGPAFKAELPKAPAMFKNAIH